MEAQSTAFLFPGQGSQSVGMGAELANVYPVAREVFQQADKILGYAITDLAWNGPSEQLNDTIHTQPALLAHSVAALKVFQALNPHFQPAFVAGHSMGELSALVASGSLDFEHALRLVQRRGELMKQAGVTTPGGMAAIIGLDIPTLESICQRASMGDAIVQISNDNCPGQVVISGDATALGQAMSLSKEAGARKVVRLAVSIAAHSHLMVTAQQAFNQAVSASALKDPVIPIVGNTTASPLKTAEEVQMDLKAQLYSRVRWTESIQWMFSQGIDTFIELGTGQVLNGLVKRIQRKTYRFSLGEPPNFSEFPLK